MKKFLGALAMVAMITLIAPAPAEAQAVGNVNVSIDLTGGILLLYYYSNLTVQMDIAGLVDATAAGCTVDAVGYLDCVNASPQSEPAGYTGGPPPTAANAPFTPVPTPAIASLASIPLTLQNVWAVRSIGGGANSQVAITSTTTAFTYGTSSSIGVVANSWLVDSANNLGAAGATIQFPDPGLGASPEVGDVLVTLDFSGATTVGVHTSNATPTYTLTATNL